MKIVLIESDFKDRQALKARFRELYLSEQACVIELPKNKLKQINSIFDEIIMEIGLNNSCFDYSLYEDDKGIR